MDFNKRLLHPLPFYMTYSGYLSSAQESAALQDLEYLQQTYPHDVKSYQSRIAEILDKLDYEGSMIYDEYPDRYTLQRLANSIVQIIRQEEQGEDGEQRDSEKWTWLTSIVQVLLCNEIYKRRHGGRRSGRIYF